LVVGGNAGSLSWLLILVAVGGKPVAGSGKQLFNILILIPLN
jgi:hypothetical protein